MEQILQLNYLLLSLNNKIESLIDQMKEMKQSTVKVSNENNHLTVTVNGNKSL